MARNAKARLGLAKRGAAGVERNGFILTTNKGDILKIPKRDKVYDGPSNYLKLKDGESVIGILRGEMHSFRMKWEGGQSIKLDEPDKSRHNRWKVNIAIEEGSDLVVKVFEYGVDLYDQFADIQDASKSKDITRFKIRISRRGTAMNTKYMAIPVVDDPISPSLRGKLEQVKLVILDNEKKKTEDAPPSWDEPMPESEDELGF